jgi:hypothetical protein
MTVIEAAHGNDGYAVWFKVLEVLGDTDGHYFCAGVAGNLAYLAAKARMATDKLIVILDTLADLGAIDQDLWDDERGIWSDNFILRLSPVYKKRKIPLPLKPSRKSSTEDFPLPKVEIGGISGAENRGEVTSGPGKARSDAGKSTKDSKEKDRIEKEDSSAADSQPGIEPPEFLVYWRDYPSRVGRPKGDRKIALERFKEIPLEDQKKVVPALAAMVKKTDNEYIPDAERFLVAGKGKFRTEPWRKWIDVHCTAGGDGIPYWRMPVKGCHNGHAEGSTFDETTQIVTDTAGKRWRLNGWPVS